MNRNDWSPSSSNHCCITCQILSGMLFVVLQILTVSLLTPCSWRNRKGNKILFKLSRMSALLTCLRGSLWFSCAFLLYLLRLPPETNNNTPWLFSSWFRSMILFVFVGFLILTNCWKPKIAQIWDIYFFLSVLACKTGFICHEILTIS